MDLAEKLSSLPARPGCYLFRGEADEVLYVGKAKSLRSRVRSYFQENGSDVRAFIPVLRRQLVDIETVVTATEKEAAILENSLIKQHQPRYNVKLRDDKEFLSLRLDARVDWPKLDVVRRPEQDSARYFGPYHTATSARRSLHLVNKHFQLRTCSDHELTTRVRPCLQHQIKRCPAPCVFPVDRAWYAEQVRAVDLFLAGRHDELTRKLEGEMKAAAADFEFELAGIYRDQLRAIEAIREQQRVVQTGAALSVAQDAVGLYREGDRAEIVVLRVRGGRVSETVDLSYTGAEVEDSELLAAFVAQHYGDPLEGGAPPPDEILLPTLPEAAEGIGELLAERAGHSVTLLRPQRGPRAHLVAMAADNAAHGFKQKRRDAEDIEGRLAQLKDRLRLPTLPRRIECCDISHLGGGDTVGAIVALVDGVAAPKRYKQFHVRDVEDGNDYGAMREVLARRFRRGADEGRGPDWDLPDLFVVDGGKGQLAVALAAAHDLGLHQLPIVALAKEKDLDGKQVVDRIFLPNQKNPIELRSHSAALVFLARARDEAHRFANRAREQIGKKRRLHSELDDVKGLGPKAKKALLSALGSLAAIRAADDATLLAVPGITARHVHALRGAG